MAVGDVSITAENLAAGASLQVQIANRSRIIPGIAAVASYGHTGISADGVTFYTFMAAGWLITGSTSASSQGNNMICLPAGYYIQITNSDTVAHDAGVIAIEY